MSAGYLFSMRRPLRGSLLGSYQFLFFDSYGWLLDGFLLTRWGEPEVTRPVLRGPVFVGVTFLDFLLNAGGHVVVFVIAGSVFAMCAVLVLVARLLKGRPLATGAIVITCLASPVAYFRPYIVADQLASTFMIGAVACLIAYRERGRPLWLMLGGVLAIVAGLTQYYGLVPFLVVGGWWWVTRLWSRKRDRWLPAVLVAVVAVTVIASASWLAAIPHATVPPHASLFRPTLAMWGFYANIWIYTFAVLVPIVGFLAVTRPRRIISDPLVAGTWITVAVLAVATLFYQWKDFRFTLPVSVMLSLALVVTVGDGSNLGRTWVRRAVLIATPAAALVIALIVSPSNFRKPRLVELRVDPGRTFVAHLVKSRTVDGLGILEACGPVKVVCASWQIPDRIQDDYRRSILETWELVATPEHSPRR